MSDTNLPLTPDQAESLLPPGERVHVYVNQPWGLVGCSVARHRAIARIREAKLLELRAPSARQEQMGHALVVYDHFRGHSLFETDMEKVEGMERRSVGTTAIEPNGATDRNRR
jgi:hypothetical protein